MNTDRVAQRGLDAQVLGRGTLTDFRLTFNKMSKEHQGTGHANIEFTRGEQVEGVLYQLADEQQILEMDPFEHAPWNYGRDVIAVGTSRGQIWAWTYHANRAVLHPGLRPEQAYLDHLLAGEDYLSGAYFRWLQSWSSSSA